MLAPPFAPLPLTRVCRLTLVWLTVVALTLATAAAAAAPLIRGHSGALAATLKVSTHTPKINTPLPITVTATFAGKPAHATAVYEFLYGGAVVSTQYPYSNHHFSFTGHYNDKLSFPASSVAFHLTLRVVVKADGHTVNLNCQITTHR